VRREEVPAEEMTWPEARRVVHEELSGLSERYRAPLTLCYLQGKTLDESAVQLGLAKSTLKARLERGRAVLRARLLRRGLGSEGALLAAAWPAAEACVPLPLFGSTTTAALGVAAGRSAIEASSARVAALTEGVLNAMGATRVKTITAAAAALAFLGLSLGALAYKAPPGRETAEGPRVPGERRAAVEKRPAPPFLLLRAGAAESVTSVAVSRDGTLVATSSFDGRVRVHDAKTGAMLRAIGAESEPGGRAVAFAPDGRSLAFAGFHMDKLVRLWDLRTGAVVRALAGHTEIETYAVAFSPGGELLASAGTDKQVLVWDLSTGALRHRLAGQAFPVTALAFSPDGATLAGGSGEKVIRLWDTATGRLRRALEGHQDWVSALAYSQDGKTIASGSCDWGYHRGRDVSRFGVADSGGQSEWRLWDAGTGRLKRAVTEKGRLLSLAFAPGGKGLACAVGNDVRLYDLGAEAPGRVLTSHEAPITCFAFAPGGAAVITGSHDRTVKRVAFPAGTAEWSLHGYWEQVNSVALSADGALIATGSSDLRFAERLTKAGARGFGPGAARLWDARTGRLLRRLGDPAEQVLAVALSPDGRRVAAGGGRPGGSGFVHVWDTKTGAPVWSAKDHSAEVQAVAFAPDGSSLASADAGGLVRLRDPARGIPIRTLAGHAGGATSAAYSADSATLAAGAADGATHLWDVATGRLAHTFRPPASPGEPAGDRGRVMTSVALSPDGQTLATCRSSVGPTFGDRAVRLWDAQTGRLKREINSPQTRSRLVAFSPDGTTLAMSGVGKAIHLYDLRTGQVRHSLQGHAHPPQSAAFSADGRLLVSGGDYRMTRVWEVATGRLLATLVTFSESRPGTASDDWLAYAADGHYDGSPGVDRYLAWRVEEDLRTPDSLREPLHRPDRLRSALRPPRPKPGSP
jgi:WD40 repeat protein